MTFLLNKILQLRSTQTVLIFIFFDICVLSVHAANSNGQKAHFQVEDKSGDLKIVATKDLAKVTSQADSVQVVVKPGMADYPVLKSDKPIVHVVNGCCGWNSISVKKSSILSTKNKFGNSKKSSNKRRLGKKLNKLRESRRKYNFFTKNLFIIKPKPESKKMNTMHKNFKPIFAIKKPTSFKTSHFIHVIESKRHSLEEMTPNKKSTLLKGEVGFQVTGSAGKLKMDVTKSGTKLSSESGTVDVLLKRKATGGNSRFDFTQPKDIVGQMVHVAPELAGGDFDNVGLRKSGVPKNSEKQLRFEP